MKEKQRDTVGEKFSSMISRQRRWTNCDHLIDTAVITLRKITSRDIQTSRCFFKAQKTF